VPRELIVDRLPRRPLLDESTAMARILIRVDRCEPRPFSFRGTSFRRHLSGRAGPARLGPRPEWS